MNDLVGRAIAESTTSRSYSSMVLTYAGDTTNSVVLQYRDVQNMLKHLRRDGIKVRYIGAGEYGTKKQRAHWHVVLFFPLDDCAIPLKTLYQWKYWPHGHVFRQPLGYKGIRYSLKYALKQPDGLGEKRPPFMSKKPPLGYSYFMDLADTYVKEGLSPQSPAYRFAGVTDAHGKHRTFWLRGRMRELFLERFIASWCAKHGQKEYPYSDLLDEFADQQFRSHYQPTEEEINALITGAKGWNAPLRPHAIAVIKMGDTTATLYSSAELGLDYGQGEWICRNVSDVARVLELSGSSRYRASRRARALSQLCQAHWRRSGLSKRSPTLRVPLALPGEDFDRAHQLLSSAMEERRWDSRRSRYLAVSGVGATSVATSPPIALRFAS